MTTTSWGSPWPETLNTLVLSEKEGSTTITNTVLYPSKEARDAALKTGMKEGAAQSFDRLAEYLKLAANEIVITRVFDAPPKVVFQTWTEPARMKAWWGPVGFTLPHCTVDLRRGGMMHFCMRAPDGQDIWCRGVYREVVEPERIVSTDSFSDKDGNIVDPAQYGMHPDWPREALITVTFAEEHGKTKFILRHAVGSAQAADRDACRGGWNEMLDRLAGYLAEDGAR
jgi:uncharacterized protein YndB with AHSA1/START domain